MIQYRRHPSNRTDQMNSALAEVRHYRAEKQVTSKSSQGTSVVSHIIGYVHMKRLAPVLIQLCICRTSLGVTEQLYRAKREEEIEQLADKDFSVKTRNFYKHLPTPTENMIKETI